MNINRAKKLFAKYINNECSKEEIQLLDAFLDSYQSENNTWSDLKIGDEDVFRKTSWERVESQINNDQKKKRYPFVNYLKYAVAASVILIVSLTIYLNKGSDIKLTEPAIVITDIQPGTDKAVLTLGDGSQIALEKGGAFQTQDANSNGEEIIYNEGNEKTSKLVHNYITIPRGGQFFIKLSDGTQVWLNSESQLKYPVAFAEGKIREVELVYGEAYFDVSPSSNHNGSKFKVLNENQEVEVFGTEFNIKAYLDEDFVYTTLVEGKVSVKSANQEEILLPNQQSKVNVKNKILTIDEIDVYSEISWKKGLFGFKNKPLKDIMKVLSRWYDVEVVFENIELETVKFNGVISKNEDLKEILTIIKNSKYINAYDINDKVIVIK